MGIKDLFRVISENAPDAVKASDIKQHFGRKIAIDASMCIYQFMIAVRSEGQQLMSEGGDTTSHLMGFFYRTLRMVDSGIKPLYVFDGKPPTLKSGELAKRTARKAEAEAGHEEAKETGTAEDVEKFARRSVRVTKEHNEECKLLLKLMGIPYVEAPCEAEAQCAALAKAGLVYAAASEDMDTLCFEAPILIRHLTFSEKAITKAPIQEIHLEKAMEGLGLTRDQFVDLCILLGCDYCETIPKVGPATALKMIREHKTIEEVVKHLPKKSEVAENWAFVDARELFLKPDVADPKTLNYKWEAPDIEGLVKFLAVDKGFNEDRVRSGAARLQKGLKQSTQARMKDFFKVIPKTEEELAAQKVKTDKKTAEKKRKATETKRKNPKKPKKNS